MVVAGGGGGEREREGDMGLMFGGTGAERVRLRRLCCESRLVWGCRPCRF